MDATFRWAEKLPWAALFVIVLIVGALFFNFAAPTGATEGTLKSLRPSGNEISKTNEQASEANVVRIEVASLKFIRVEQAETKSTGPTIQAPARVAFREGAVSEVSAPLAGRVVEIHAKVGDQVRAGDPLLTLDSPLAAQARSDLARAMVELHTAADVSRRNDDMMKQGIGIEVEKLAADTRLNEAQVELRRAEKAASFVGSGQGSTVTIQAPVAGTVIERKTTVGAIVDPSSGFLLQIGDAKALWVVAEVFEREIFDVKVGAVVQLEISSVNKAVAGRVVAVGAAVRADSRRVPVYIEIDEAGLPLRAGMYARASVSGGPATGVTLPTEAVLVKEDGRHLVYVEKTVGEYVPREVDIGLISGGKVHILRGLNSGDRVVTSGTLLLDGASEKLL